MRVVHVVRQFHPAQGGMENAVYHLSREQLKLGISVRVVTLNRIFCSDVVLDPTDIVDGVEIVRVPYQGSLRYPIAPTVLKYLRDADIVHVHGIDFFFDFIALTSLFRRRKLVVSTHGGFFHTPSFQRLKKIFFKSVTRTSIRQYGFVAASSTHDAEQFRPIRKSGLRVLENGVDTDKFAGIVRSSLPKQVIYFGRLAPNKNVGALLPLVAAMRRSDPAWRLVVAGRPMGLTAEELLESARQAKLEEAITVQESPSDADLRHHIERSSVFCSPSLYEGFGIAAIEAISGGLFVALSDIPAHRSTIEATGAGILVNYTDPEAVARNILAALEERKGGPAMTRQQLARTYSWAGAAGQFLQIYNDVLGREHRTLLGLRLRVTNQPNAIAALCAAILQATPLRVAFVNAHLALQAVGSLQVKEALASFMLLNDGLGVDLASIALFGRRFPENLNGTDFTPALLDALKPGCRIFLLGATGKVISSAASYYQKRWPQHRLVGFHDGYFSTDQEAEIAERVRASAADLVLVGMGCPRQELWLSRHVPSACPVGIGVGALFDFQTSEVRRAPAFIRRARLEWLFRLVQEPKRLAGRYLAGNAAFLWHVTRQWFSGVRA